MTRTLTKRRQYGKQSKKTKAEQLFAELPPTPARKPAAASVQVMGDEGEPGDQDEEDDDVGCLTSQLHEFDLDDDDNDDNDDGDGDEPSRESARTILEDKADQETATAADERDGQNHDADHSTTVVTATGEETKSTTRTTIEIRIRQATKIPDEVESFPEKEEEEDSVEASEGADCSLRVLSWEDVCPSGDCITKIAEASYAEVYRVANERGVSIIKVIRLESPIKAQTKAQVRSGLVDEQPHSEDDLDGELRISEWLADIPGFVVYKERYIVQGRMTKQLLETHQAFQKRLKREDPGRAQYYPSPSRYVDGTRFMVVELGDAGVALEDWRLESESQLWDIFLLEAIALARAEDIAMFEHRDLHEGNLCIRQVRPPRARDADSAAAGFFGFSGVDITILDYGLSRAEDLGVDDAEPVAFDLERDLSLFSSTHAPQCKVYRQMRSYLLRGDRRWLPPEAHATPYEHARGVGGPLDWKAFAPYTNVLWLAYLYEYLVGHFGGGRRELGRFRRETAELWAHLDPEAAEGVPCFGSAGDVVGFALEAGWVREDQLQGGADGSSFAREGSIIVSREEASKDGGARRSTRLGGI